MPRKKAAITDGINWPEIPGVNGKPASRSSTGTATKILQAALSQGAPNDPLTEKLSTVSGKGWRFGYQKFMVRTTTVMAEADEATVCKMARAGLEAAHSSFDFIRNGETNKLNVAMENPSEDMAFETGHVIGSGNNNPSSPIEVPYNKKVYAAAEVPALLRSVMINDSDMEGSVLAAVENILAKGSMKDCEDLSDLYVVLLGATSEMGPLEFLLDHGANVIGLARGGTKKWSKLIERSKRSRGQLYFPMAAGSDASSTDLQYLASNAGADALLQTPEIAEWLSRIVPGKMLYIYSLIYLDGEKYVRASMAMDAIADTVTRNRGGKNKTGLLYIGTPSSAHLVPASCEEVARRIFQEDTPLWQKALHAVGLLKRNKYIRLESGNQQEEYAVLDALSSVQGPNYALAKYIQNWRAMLARTEGKQFVSVNVAPPAMTASVMHAPKIAAAAPYFSLFKPNKMYFPDTVSAILSIMLLADIRNKNSASQPKTKLGHPMQLVADQSWHGGSWSAPFTADSTGIAAYLVYLFRKVSPVIAVSIIGIVSYLSFMRH
jgi:hypothetical protein|eukprot:g7402.t1